jgi:preprotein translocase subunit SecB
MQNLSEDDTKRAIASIAPAVLFPYARAVVSNLVSQGGFPQLLLPPVNFDALYLGAQAQSVPAASQAVN